MESAQEGVSSVRGAARWLLWDARRQRLRTPWRLLVHAVLVLLGYAASAAVAWVGGSSPEVLALAIGLQSLWVLVTTWACARWIDRRAPDEIVGGFDRGAAAELAVGVLIGAGAIASVAGVEQALGLARYTSLPLDTTTLLRVIAASLFFVAVAVDEELWFRGYQLTNLAEGFERWWGPTGARGAALVVSSTTFGLAHALNPNAGLLSTANIAVGGVLLGVTFAMTGRLWVAIGLHFAWNTAQCFFDMPVSGQHFYDGLLVQREALGDDVVTGGVFGPEAGLLGLGAMCAGTALCALHARWLPRRVPATAMAMPTATSTTAATKLDRDAAL